MPVTREEQAAARPGYKIKPPPNLWLIPFSLVVAVLALAIARLWRRVTSVERRQDRAEHDLLAKDCLERAARFAAEAVAAEAAGDVTRAARARDMEIEQRRMASSFRRRR